ncbi:hypothetical protein Zmor_005940 [Zophobas morio]|uniref:Regulatory protein zeste n=1 Tax=Zophobas morio TaxID=2755281 RepID=A0AA38IVE4_9CUCU|nr:hypothetical protein Zmor_005940 [Zophobas morio]
MDSKTNNGRKNYTDREKTLFADIIASKKSVIENKRTSVQAMRARSAAWQEVLQEFNASADHSRNLKQLKILYDNLKRKARKDLAAEHQRDFQDIVEELGLEEGELQSYTAQAKEEQRLEKTETFKTGGGPSNAPGISGTSLQILSILGDTVVPVSNIFDSGASYHKGICNGVYYRACV